MTKGIEEKAAKENQQHRAMEDEAELVPPEKQKKEEELVPPKKQKKEEEEFVPSKKQKKEEEEEEFVVEWGGVYHSMDREEFAERLQGKFYSYSNSLRSMNLLDDKFVQLRRQQDKSRPDFVVKSASHFYEVSEKCLNNLDTALQQQVVDFKQIDDYVHQLQDSSFSIGANRVKHLCITFRKLCAGKNLDGCKRCLQEVKQAYKMVKNKLEMLFYIEQKILEAGGTVPTMV